LESFVDVVGNDFFCVVVLVGLGIIGFSNFSCSVSSSSSPSSLSALNDSDSSSSSSLTTYDLGALRPERVVVVVIVGVGKDVSSFFSSSTRAFLPGFEVIGCLVLVEFELFNLLLFDVFLFLVGYTYMFMRVSGVWF
jgi:hypothetical protein